MDQNQTPSSNQRERRLSKNPDERYVFVERPRCPCCGSVRLRSYHSKSEGDVVTRYTRCQACDEKFIVVAE